MVKIAYVGNDLSGKVVPRSRWEESEEERIDSTRYYYHFGLEQTNCGGNSLTSAC